MSDSKKTTKREDYWDQHFSRIKKLNKYKKQVTCSCVMTVNYDESTLINNIHLLFYRVRLEYMYVVYEPQKAVCSSSLSWYYKYSEFLNFYLMMKTFIFLVTFLTILKRPLQKEISLINTHIHQLPNVQIYTHTCEVVTCTCYKFSCLHMCNCVWCVHTTVHTCNNVF